LERAFAHILLRHETLESAISEKCADFVRGREPRGIRFRKGNAASRVTHDGDRVNQRERAVRIEAGSAQRALVYAESKAAVSGRFLKAVSGESVLPQLVTTSGQANHDVLNTDFVTEIFNLVGAADETEMGHALVLRIPLGEQHFLHVTRNVMQRLE